MGRYLDLSFCGFDFCDDRLIRLILLGLVKQPSLARGMLFTGGAKALMDQQMKLFFEVGDLLLLFEQQGFENIGIIWKISSLQGHASHYSEMVGVRQHPIRSGRNSLIRRAVLVDGYRSHPAIDSGFDRPSPWGLHHRASGSGASQGACTRG